MDRCTIRSIGSVVVVALALLAARSFAGTNAYETCPSNTNYTTCPSVAIPDAPGPAVEVTLSVPNDFYGPYIQGVTVFLWIQHTYQGDLIVDLISPAGTTLRMIDRPGAGTFGANDLGCPLCFDPPPPPCRLDAFVLTDLAASIYDSPAVPAGGLDCGGFPLGGRTYRPVQALSGLYGESKVGTWRLRVQDMAGFDTGAIRYFGLSIDSRTIGAPTAIINQPSGCLCHNTPITGTALDPAGSILGWTLDYSPSISGPWTLLASSLSPVNNGTLALWNAVIPSATDGRIFLRLTVANELGVSTVAYVETASDREFSTVAITSPVQNRVVGGNVCCEGTITDYCFDDFTVEVAPPPFNAFSPVPPGTFTAPVYNDPIVGWNTRLGVADGSYRLRFSGTSTCGLTRTEYRDVVVDNTAPVAVLTAPVPCTWRSGMIPIAGTASDAHFSGWTLQYAGGLASGWTTIASGTSPVIAATFTTWNTTGLTPCAYTVRLLVSDSALVDCLYSNTSEYTVSIDLGCQADINRSGGPPTVQDIFDFLAAYFGGCP